MDSYKYLFTKGTLLFNGSKVKILPQYASQAKKPNLVETHGFQTTLTGKASAPPRVKKVSFTNKIRRLTSHLELHRKDYLSQRGLRKILRKHQQLQSYLAKKNRVRYKELIGHLGIREKKVINLKSPFELFDLVDLEF